MNQKDQMAKSVKKRLSLIQDYKRVFSSEQGKRVLHDLMNEHGFLKSSFTKDAHEMAFKEGGRNAVLRIMSVCEMDPDLVEKHILEANRNAKT